MKSILAGLTTLALAGATPALAQVTTPDPATDHFVSFAAFKAGDSSWKGAFASNGVVDPKPAPHLEISWTFDYGSISAKQVTPTSTQPSSEDALSKNDGKVTVGWWTGRTGTMVDWNLSVNGGVHDARSRDAGTQIIRHTTNGLATVDAGISGNKLLASKVIQYNGGPVEVSNAAISWKAGAEASRDQGIDADGTARWHNYVDPAVEFWLSGLRIVNLSKPTTTEPTGFDVLVFHAQAGETIPDGGQLHRSYWDASMSVYASEHAGIMVRHFDGHFGHNLADHKAATQILFVVKF